MTDLTEQEGAALQAVGAATAELSRVANGDELPPIVLKFYVIAETMDEQGRRGLEAFRSADASVWDAIGLLSFELEVEKRKIGAPSDGS
jgi:hypothetical protein